jgi:hypothetical protein
MKKFSGTVQSIYQSFSDLDAYNQSHNVARQCGFESARQLWDSNPVVEGHINSAYVGLSLNDFERGFLDAAKDGAEIDFDPPSIRKAINLCENVCRDIKDEYKSGREYWEKLSSIGAVFFVQTGDKAFLV